MRKLLTFIAIASFSVFVTADDVRAQTQCKRPYVFFDLGGTLVDTNTYNFNPMFYMKGALRYLAQLQRNGHPLGLLVDIPESWGRDFPQFSLIKDTPTAKWRRTLAFIRGEIPEDQASWSGPAFEPRFYGTFEGTGSAEKFIGNVFLPQTNAERKSAGSNIIFVRARAAADRDGCEAVYMGEDLKEMKMAEGAGLVPYAVGQPNRPFYLPASQIAAYVDDFKKQKSLRYAMEAARSDRETQSVRRPRSSGRPLQ